MHDTAVFWGEKTIGKLNFVLDLMLGKSHSEFKATALNHVGKCNTALDQ